jgi:hypothetical protein
MFAYIDPGAGSLAIQAIIAAALAIPFFFRQSIAAVVTRLRRADRDGPAKDAAPIDPEG